MRAGGVKVTRFVHRETPQGCNISPLLWVVAIDEVLKMLNKGGAKIVAYADDSVLIVSGPTNVVVPLILTHRFMAWLEALWKDTKKGRVQRTANICITRACRTCPSAVLNVVLLLVSINFYVISIAAQSKIRLKEIGLWRQSLTEPATIFE